MKKALQRLLLILASIVNVLAIVICCWILVGWVLISHNQEHLIFHFHPIRTAIYFIILGTVQK